MLLFKCTEIKWAKLKLAFQKTSTVSLKKDKFISDVSRDSSFGLKKISKKNICALLFKFKKDWQERYLIWKVWTSTTIKFLSSLRILKNWNWYNDSFKYILKMKIFSRESFLLNKLLNVFKSIFLKFLVWAWSYFYHL